MGGASTSRMRNEFVLRPYCRFITEPVCIGEIAAARRIRAQARHTETFLTHELCLFFTADGVWFVTCRYLPISMSDHPHIVFGGNFIIISFLFSVW